MKFLIPLLVIIVLLVLIGFRVLKQRKLMKKGEEYEKKVREAKVTRFQYIQALQKTRDSLTEVTGIEEKLTSLKAEIIGYHGDLREKIEHLRQQRKQSTGSDLDNRTLAQMKNDLTQLWAHTNSRKKVCRGIVEEHNESKRKYRLQEDNERQVTDRWLAQKDEVMKTYRELKDKLKLTDPKKSFS
jgi:hypothetical protein